MQLAFINLFTVDNRAIAVNAAHVEAVLAANSDVRNDTTAVFVGGTKFYVRESQDHVLNLIARVVATVNGEEIPPE